MKGPHIPHPIKDPEQNVTYIVMAYRALSRAEVVRLVRIHQTRTKKKPARGSVVTILTVAGATPGT